MVEALLNHGADVKQRDERTQSTVLHLLAEKRSSAKGTRSSGWGFGTQATSPSSNGNVSAVKRNCHSETQISVVQL
jgi:hypothetical protein